MSPDPFSDILSLANAQSVVTGAFTACGSWALRFPVPGKVKLFGMVKGGAWLRVDGAKKPVRIGEGDVFLLSGKRAFVLASDLDATAVDSSSVFEGHGGVTRKLGRRDDCFVIGGYVRWDERSGELLTDVLPALVHVRAGSDQATTLQWLLDRLVREREEKLPGASLASAQLAQLVFVEILRAHLAGSGKLSASWLRALGDPRIARALQRMHRDPARAWRLGELAKAAAMSRTAFAVTFKAVAGMSPLAYLTAWRMRLATRALRDEDTPVSMLAGSLGYTSESAFSHAFKRVTGQAPKHYRAQSRATASSSRSGLATAAA